MIGAIIFGTLGEAAVADEEAWRTSPFYGAVNGATGKPIPWECSFEGQYFNLGKKVSLHTSNGTVYARCDLNLNNTTWVPTTERCTFSSGVRR